LEKSKTRLSQLAWNRQHRGIPTFPQLRLLRSINHEPDISLVIKSGHFNLLRTGEFSGDRGGEDRAACVINEILSSWLEGFFIVSLTPGYKARTELP
jgi:hypothetical protein